MMTPVTPQWGAPLTGAQMKLLRNVGLPDGTEFEVFYPPIGDWCNDHPKSPLHPDESYRLPSDHPAYKLLEAGWLDGRNVALWFGGDKAPDDRLAAGEVLLRGGRTITCVLRWAHNGSPEDVIAYIRKAECDHLGKIVELTDLKGFQCTACGKSVDRRAFDMAKASIPNIVPAPINPQQAEIERLRELLREQNAVIERLRHEVTIGSGTVTPLRIEAADQLEAQKAEIERLREVLAWYGEQTRLCRLIHSEGDEGRDNLSNDGGGRARAALGQKP